MAASTTCMLETASDASSTCLNRQIKLKTRKAVYEYDDHVAKQSARTRIQISIIGNYQCDFRKFASYISVSKVGVYVALVGNVYCT